MTDQVLTVENSQFKANQFDKDIELPLEPINSVTSAQIVKEMQVEAKENADNLNTFFLDMMGKIETEAIIAQEDQRDRWLVGA